jgi:hypothetical protein
MARPDYSHLNPDDPHDAAIIDAEWRKMRARRIRRANAKGWTRVAAVVTVYLLIAAGAITFVYLLAILLLAFAGTN